MSISTIPIDFNTIKKESVHTSIPTFTLRGVNIKDVLDIYINNDLNDRTNINKPTNNIKIENKPKKHIYMINGINIELTNVILLENLKSPICMWCRKNIDTEKYIPCGIPVKYKQENDLHIYTMIDCYCGFSCALAGLYDRLDRNGYSIDPHYKLSHFYLIKLYNSYFGSDKKLIKANDWRLYETNMGSIKNDDDDTSNTKLYDKIGISIYTSNNNKLLYTGECYK